MSIDRPSNAANIRPWVARLGAYLRIFGVPLDGRTLCSLEERAKEREGDGG